VNAKDLRWEELRYQRRHRRYRTWAYVVLFVAVMLFSVYVHAGGGVLAVGRDPGRQIGMNHWPTRSATQRVRWISRSRSTSASGGGSTESWPTMTVVTGRLDTTTWVNAQRRCSEYVPQRWLQARISVRSRGCR